MRGLNVGRRTRRGLATVVLVLGAGSQLGWSCEARCEQPFRPVGTQYLERGSEPVGEWPVTGEVRAPVLPALDTDGDGTTDTQQQSPDERTLTIGRASGDLVLTVPEPVWFPYYASPVPSGDLDGDGRGDLIVATIDGAGGQRSYVVPGATPDGTYALADRFASPFAPRPGEAGVAPYVVGDVDGDGRDDLATQVYVGGTTPRVLVWLAADLAIAPGSPAVAASYDLGARLSSIVRLGGRNALALEFGEVSAEDPYFDVALWLPEAKLRFTTEGSEPSRVGPGASLSVYQDGDQSWLVLRASNRGADQLWAFDLDDLCAWAPVTGG